MTILTTIWTQIKSVASTIIGKINWTTSRVIDPDKLKEVQQLLAENNYIILTRHNGHLSTYAISLAHWLLTGKKGFYSHALLNVEDTVSTTDDYEFIQATAPGVAYAGFDAVFDQQVGAVCLLKPKTMKIEEWSDVVGKAKTDLGKPYDLALDPAQTAALDCVELVRNALQGEPNYSIDYADLEKAIAKYDALDPQMYYECPDFEIVWENRGS
jgi:hypothetical protein